MASSSNQKSSSSASRAQKPTFRRAPKGAVASKPAKPAKAAASAAAPARKSAGSYAVPSPRTGKVSRKPAVKAPKPAKTTKVVAPKAVQKAAPGGAVPRPATRPLPKKRSFKSVAAPARPVAPKPAKRRGGIVGAIAGALAGFLGLLGAALSRLPLPKLPGKAALLAALGVAAAIGVGFIVVANTGLFAASDVRIEAGEHVTAEEMEALIELPENATLLNLDAGAIDASLQKSPWLLGADIERQFPHTLIIRPRERALAAIAYIAADDVAWGIGADGAWIAPLTLAVTVDAEGEVIEDTSRLPTGASVTQLTGVDAAQLLARQAGAVLLTDVSADVSPESGAAVESDVVKAGLAYANGFSPEFIAQVKSISVPSVEAVSVMLTSGVQVSMGAPERIETKEKVVTKLLEQESGVTYINVRTPGSETFRSAGTD